MRTTRIKLCKNGKVVQDTPNLCNQYENGSNKIIIDLDEELIKPDFFYYLACASPGKIINQYAIPLKLISNKLEFIVGSGLSRYAGVWNFCIIIKNIEMADNDIGTDGLIYISNRFTGRVAESFINAEQLEEQIEDSNLIIIYDDLQTLTNTVMRKLENGEFESDNIKVGETSSTAIGRKLFFKVVQ